MATHSSVLAWRIPGTVGPGGLLSMGSHRVGHDWSDLAAAVAQLIERGWPGFQPFSSPVKMCLVFTVADPKVLYTVRILQYCFLKKKKKNNHIAVLIMSFPGGTSGKEPACHCRRHKKHGFDPWVGKIPWRKAWQPTPVFLPRESHAQKSLVGYSPQGSTETDTTEVT